MKHFTTILFLALLLFACKKENTSPAIPVENSSQMLTKISKTIDFGGGTYSIEYGFNSTGKIVKDDDKIYERDGQQRITKIHYLDKTVNGILEKGNDVVVHYNDKTSNQVAYTTCIIPEISATDSTVYQHDQNGNLITILFYDNYTNSKNTPDTTYYLGYINYKYDDSGNLLQMDKYAINYKGELIHCSYFLFGGYDNKINPLYSGDEVRMADFSCENMLNNSKNNFTNGSGYTKTYEYRQDGRPRTCIVQHDGRKVSKLVFEYK